MIIVIAKSSVYVKSNKKLTFSVKEKYDIMDISFEKERLEILCNNKKELQKRYGKKIAEKIAIRLIFLASAPNLESVPIQPPYNRHKLLGDKKGHFAIDIDGRKDANRIIFIPDCLSEQKKQVETDLKAITAIKIVQIGDYH